MIGDFVKTLGDSVSSFLSSIFKPGKKAKTEKMPGGQRRRQRREPEDLFEAMGFPSMRSMFDDPFFRRDPFDDPFFRDPFAGSPFGGGGPFRGGLLGGGPFSAGPGSLFGPGFPSHPFVPQLPQIQHPAQQQHQQQQQRHLPPAPSVQEIDASSHPHASGAGNSGEPIIEDPSDEEEEEREREVERERHREERRSRGRTEDNPGSRPNHQTLMTTSHPFPGFDSLIGGGGGGSSMVYQSSFVSHSGFGGTQYYTSSSSRRVGPSGVFEAHHSHRDSTGNEGLTLTRGIHEKGRTLSRQRRGQEEVSREVLHNITQEEAATFDQTWQEHARGMPGGARGRQGVPQLPSTEHQSYAREPSGHHRGNRG